MAGFDPDYFRLQEERRRLADELARARAERDCLKAARKAADQARIRMEQQMPDLEMWRWREDLQRRR